MLRVQFARQSKTAGRLLSTSAVLRNGTGAGTIQIPRKAIGGVRGGIVGFLFGFSIASSFAAYHLLEEYRQASAALQASVDELKLSTERVSEHVGRIQAVEKDLKALRDASAPREDLSRLRTEVKKLYDGLHVEILDLRAHIWGIQQDLNKVLKEESTTVDYNSIKENKN